MASVKPVFRPSVKAGRQAGSLFLRVVHERRAKTITILRGKLYPEEWDAERACLIFSGALPDYERLKKMEGVLSDAVARVNDIIDRLDLIKGVYSVEDIICRYRHSTDENRLSGYAATLARELWDNGQYRTAKAYGTVCRGFIAFNKGVDIPLAAINAGLIKRFERHLKDNGKQPNTISYYMRNIRAIYNKAIAEKRIPRCEENPFSGVFTGVEETKKRALTADEVNQLKNIDFEKLLSRHDSGAREHKQLQNLHYARRLFFFCLYAQGMSFVDLCHLKKSNVKGDEIRYYRKKTGGRIIVPINEGMRRIMRSFEEEVKDSEYLFPILNKAAGKEQTAYETALRTQNKRLKQLAGLAGAAKTVSTHVARHSWATICKNELLPVSVICEGLGHSSEKMTRKYLGSFDHAVLRNAGKAVLTAISRLPRGSGSRVCR